MSAEGRKMIMGRNREGIETPLLESLPNSGGRASECQTSGNIIVSVVGTGFLGFPFAFRIAGWLVGSLGIAFVAMTACYCMLLLVQCRAKVESEEPLVEVRTYGDIGHKSFGPIGRYVMELIILVGQCGGAISYLVFIGENLHSVFQDYGLTSTTSYIFLLVPIEVGLSWIGSLSALAPFTIFADICTVLAMGIVVKEDIQKTLGLQSEIAFGQGKAITSNIGRFPLAAGLAIFCFDGFGMTLSLENSMEDRTKFPRLLAQTFSGLALVYIVFGLCGYVAFGDETRDIVILNLPRNWSTLAVQIGLCLGLVFTLPIKLHPISEIIEGRLNFSDNNSDSNRLRKIGICISRAIVVVVLAVVASCVPAFGVFISLMGSTICALNSFVLPATFHLKLFGSSLHLWQKALDFVLWFFGLFFAAYGIYNAVVGV